jgi:hypothetical protein
MFDDTQGLESVVGDARPTGARDLGGQAARAQRAAGQVVLKLKTPWRDGATHLVISPLEFLPRLLAPIPPYLLRTSMTELRRPVLAVGCPVWVGCRLSLRPEESQLQLSKPTLTVPLSAPLSALPRHGQGPDRRSD